jgi:hypothetical protein
VVCFDGGALQTAPQQNAPFVAFMTRGVRHEIPAFRCRIMDLGLLMLLALLLLQQA